MNRLNKKTAPKKIVVTLVERSGKARSFHIANVHAATLPARSCSPTLTGSRR